jgi:hypothetical protein
MSSGQHVAERRAAQHDLTAIQIEPVGEVGATARYQLHAPQLAQVGEARSGHPLGQAYRVGYAGNTGNALDTAGNLSATCHHSPHLALEWATMALARPRQPRGLNRMRQ